MTSEERAPRYEVTIFVTTGDEMQPFGRTRDLSITGAFVETAERPAVGETRELAIVWGEDTFGCSARVIRHADDGVGVAFLAPEEPFERAVMEILQNTPLKPILPHR